MGTLPLVLAIEPDLRQAAIVKRVVRERVQADVAVVDSKDTAIEAIRTTMPDVLLLSALLSPRDEDDLIAHLRTLEGAAHLQTHTIPQLASALGPGEKGSRGGLLSAFRRKKQPDSAPAGCDPDLFADEIRVFLQRAADKKREAAESGGVAPATMAGRRSQAPVAMKPQEAAEGAAPSSWSSPFEWRPSTPSSFIPNPESSIPHPESGIANPESAMAHPESAAEAPEFAIEAPEFAIEEPSFAPPLEEPQIFAAPAVVIPEPVLETVPEAAPEMVVAPLPDPIPEPIAEMVPEPVAAIAVAPPPAVYAETEIVIPRIQDRGSGIGDQGLRIKDSILRRPAPLSSWARKERVDPPQPTGELGGLLAALGVPESLASVSYARGCRIRRVRVRPVREPQAGSHGAVILSRRMLAELREHIGT